MRLTFVGQDPDSNPTGSRRCTAPTGRRGSFSIAYRMVEAGEDIRWVPRRLVSSIAIPGNDLYLFDDHLVVFLLYAGSGLATDRVTSTDPADVRLCRSAFNAVWQLAVTHRDYQP